MSTNSGQGQGQGPVRKFSGAPPYNSCRGNRAARRSLGYRLTTSAAEPQAGLVAVVRPGRAAVHWLQPDEIRRRLAEEAAELGVTVHRIPPRVGLVLTDTGVAAVGRSHPPEHTTAIADTLRKAVGTTIELDINAVEDALQNGRPISGVGLASAGDIKALAHLVEKYR